MTEQKQGLLAATGAYLWWGLAPIYFKALGQVSAGEILAHRVGWCVPTILLLMWLFNTRNALLIIWQDRRLKWALTVSSLLVANNWFLFTWAVNNDRVLETSLGYFINPLLSIFLGVLFLKEHLSRLQWMAVGLAAGGVAFQIVSTGQLPWLSLALALTFGLYGLIRKQTAVDALNGLLVETLIALPLALAAIGYFAVMGTGQFLNSSWQTNLLLSLGGLVTAVPLVLFAIGARRLPLYAVGFLQFIAPTITFFLAVFLYNEAFDVNKAVTFACIWCGLAVYLIDSLLRRRKAVTNA